MTSFGTGTKVLEDRIEGAAGDTAQIPGIAFPVRKTVRLLDNASDANIGLPTLCEFPKQILDDRARRSLHHGYAFHGWLLQGLWPVF
jgi:hypothetical protein